MFCRRIFAFCVIACAFVAAQDVLAGQPKNPKHDDLGPLAGKIDHRLIPYLNQIKAKQTTPAQAAASIRAEHEPLLSKAVAGDSFLVRIDCRITPDLLAAIRNTSVTVTHVSEQWNTVMAIATLPQIQDLSALDGIRSVQLEYEPRHRQAGIADNHADIDEKADQLRSLFGVDGTGQKIGILSDTVNRTNAVGSGTTTGTVPNAILTNTKPQNSQDLSASIQVVDFGPNTGSDEGEGMLELVHDIAPGAQLAFGTAYNDQTTFAANITKLRTAANCTITVDDVGYFAEPMFQDGPIAQAIIGNFQNNVPHFSAAGNDGDTGVVGVYKDVNPAVDNTNATPNGADFHDWGIGGATPSFLPITIPAGVTVYIIFQWDQPFSSYGLGPGSQADLDIYLYRNANTTRILARGNAPQGVAGTPSGDPVEVISYTTNTTRTVYLAMDHYDGVRGNRFRLIISTNGIALTYPGVPASFFNSGAMYGHAATRECIAVGAIFYGDIKDNGTQGPDLVNINAEDYSSKGGVGLQGLPYYFDTAGNLLANPDLRDKPDIAAADGTNTSVFGGDSAYDTDTLPNFFGTSAAAPNAAAVAALLMQRFPGLKPVELLTLMRSGARDIIANNPVSVAGPDDHTGAGLVDALGSARTSIWSGGGSDDQFSTGGNWVGNNAPVAGDNLFFKGTTRPTPFNNGAVATFGSIIFATDGFNVSGSPMTLSRVLAVSNTSGSNTIDAPLTFGNFTVIRTEPSTSLAFGTLAAIDNGGFPLVVDSSGTCSISGVLSGAGSLTQRSGTGTLTLSGANTYGGGTSITAGALFANNTSGSATGSGAVSLDGRATLRGTGIISGAVTSLSTAASIWPGTTTQTSAPPGTLTAASASFSSGGALKVRAANSSSGATPSADVLALSSSGSVLTLSANSSLNLVLSIQNGSYSNQYATIVNCTGSGTIQNKYAAASISSNHGWPVTGISLVYLDAGNVEVDPTVTPAKRIALKFSGTITPVTLEHFSATVDGPGVLLQWSVAGELENLGYNLYRRPAGDEDACWSNVNSAPIAGRLTTSESCSYRFYDDWPDAGDYEYRIETINLRGDRNTIAVSEMLSLDQQRDSAPSLAALDAAIFSSQAELHSERHQRLGRVAQNRDLKASVNAISREHAATRAVPQHSSTVVGESIKVTCSGNGVLFIPQNALPAGVSATALSAEREGRSVDILASSAAGLLLYAPGYDDEYTDKDAFFLRRSLPPVARDVRKAQGLFTGTATPVTEAAATAIFRYSDVYFDWSITPLEYPPWFSSQYLAPGTTQPFTLNLPCATSKAATLTVHLWSLSGGAHTLQAYVNGAYAGVASWSGDGQALTLNFSIPAGALRAGQNTLELRTPDDSGISLLHSISVDYTRSLSGSEPFQVALTSQSTLYEISSLASSDVWIVDPGDGDNARLIPSESQAQPDRTFKCRFVACGTNVLVVPRGRELQPLSIATRRIKPLPQGLNYLATGPAQFASALAPLIDARSKEGLRSAFVDQEDLFDYYGFGRYGPAPIRAAVREIKPRFLLLAGRTTYDYRDYTPPYVDPLCPTFLVPTTYLWLSHADALFGDLGRGYPEVAVGRLPANTPAELSAMVRQTLNYSGAPVSGETAMLVADRAETHGVDFAAECENIANSSPEIAWSKTYLGVNVATAPEITQALQNATDAHTDLIVYVGHGNSRVWGRELPRILTVDDVAKWHGSAVLLQSTCNGNWMARDEIDYHSIAIQGMCQPQGGIVASISTSTYMESAPAVEFMQTLLRSAAAEDSRWGEVLLKTQQWAHQRSQNNPGDGNWFADLVRTESLLGDPALRVYRQPMRPPAAKSREQN
jgi:autotransporter-associated beta strand protein